MQPGIWCVHKPIGATSFSLVKRFQEEIAKAGEKHPVCHGGTLDPFAEGLVVLLVGQATRIMDLLHPLPKVYEAEVVWGAETDNGDPLGKVVERGSVEGLSASAIEAALAGFLGWQDQVPPATSAKKIDGEPAYKKAHRGETVVLPPSKVYLHQARFVSHELPRSSRLVMTCRGGYYVRSLARDLGRALGCRAHLGALRRTAIGPMLDPPADAPQHIGGEELLNWCPSRSLDEASLKAIQQGKDLEAVELAEPTWRPPEGFPLPEMPVRALMNGRLMALLRREGEKLHPFANLRGGM